MSTSGNLQRIFCLFSGDADEECVGAIVEGRLPGVIDRPPPEPFVAMLSYVSLGPPTERDGNFGQRLIVRKVLGESRKPVGQRCSTIDAALAWLEEQKQALLSSGWYQVSLDGEHDPD